VELGEEAAVARIGGRTKAYRDRLVRLLARGPKRPSELTFRSWFGVFKRTITEFIDDDLNDRAASLTYYGILSIFPGLLVLVSGLGLLGKSATNTVVANLQQLAPGPTRDLLSDLIKNVRDHQTTAGVLAVTGLVIAFYSATSYIGGFMRAANAIYDVPEGRPLWKTVPIQLAFTAITGIFLVVSALSVFLTGQLAVLVGRLFGFKEQTVRVFGIAKWPVLVLAAALLIALLYWAAPNARQGGFRWITPGSLLAVFVWVAVSIGFAVYIAKFATYDRTYGTLAGVIVFLLWLWLTNVAILLGAEFDAELSRARAIAAGLPPDAEPYLPLRDVPKPRLKTDHEHVEFIIRDVEPPAESDKKTIADLGREQPSNLDKQATGTGDPVGTGD
jgi:membrane protein